MRKFTFIKSLFLAVALLAGNAVWGQASVNSVLYEETFGSYGTSSTTFSASTMSSYDKSGSTTLVAGDKNSLTFAGANAMYSTTTATNMTSGNVWINKNTTGYLEIANVPIYNATNVKIAYSQAGASQIDVIVNGTVVGGTATAGADKETLAFAVSGNTITIKFLRTNTGTNVRLDNIRVIATEVTLNCTSPDFLFDETSVTKLITDGKFTNDFISDNTSEMVWSSSDTNVATVNPSTGEVTIVGAGTTNIKVTQIPDGTYCAIDESYTLTVTPTTPTLTVTELTVPEMTVVTGLTDTETVNVSGAALTADILVTIDGADAAMFSVLPASIAQSAGEASGAVTVTYSPTAPGTHTATLKFNSTGATEVTRTLTGTSTMATPVAIDGSGVSQTGFTANWNAVAGATEYELSVVSRAISGTPATELFFSEYIEGSSNNKAIEIFNGTGTTVDLTSYSIDTYTNGGTTPAYTLALTGTLANNDVYVVYNSAAVAEIKDKGDVASNITYFNGNDAVVLKKGETIIDIIGRIGEDPGTAWTADGGYSTAEKTLVRKSSVNVGISENPTSGFPTLATEWDLYAQNNSADLGSHTFSSMTVTETPIAGSPFTVTGETSKAIADLTAGTTYYYTVVAKNGSVATAVSNEVAVTTSTGTGLSNTVKNMNLRAVNGNIVLNAEAGQLVEVYNSIGQKVGSRLTSEGVNTIPARVKGVVFVKIGSEVSKLIME